MVSLFFGSNENNLTGNVVYNNTDYGIYLDGSNNNTLTNNTAYNTGTGTQRFGIWLENSNENNLTGNVMYNNKSLRNLPYFVILQQPHPEHGHRERNWFLAGLLHK